MLKDMLSWFEIDRKAFNTQKGTALLGTIISACALGALAGLEAAGAVKEADESETTDPE
jgi:hypothetical protein